MTTETAPERLRLVERDVADRQRLAVLRADAVGLTLRFAQAGSDEVAAELRRALEACLHACEVIVVEVIAARERLGAGGDQEPGPVPDGVARTREDRASWLMSLRAPLLRRAADNHRKAEIARRSGDARDADRLFAVKNRCESLAAGLRDLAARPAGGND
jgi:hypothetical protein